MKTNFKKIFLSWSILLAFISILFIIQTSFWPDILLKYNLAPQLTLPLIIYFFLQKDLFSSLLLALFVSLISYSFSAVPLPHLLIIYVMICLVTQFCYKIFFGNKTSLFFFLLFISHFLFPILEQSLLNITTKEFYFSIDLVAIFFNSLATLFCGFLFYSFLQKYIKEKVRF